MKTTEEISNEIEMFEYNNLSGYDNKKEKDFVRFYNKIWYSEEEIKEILNLIYFEDMKFDDITRILFGNKE